MIGRLSPVHSVRSFQLAGIPKDGTLGGKMRQVIYVIPYVIPLSYPPQCRQAACQALS